MDKEMSKRIQRMASRTWDVIGGDCLQCLEDAGEKPIMPRDHVIESVCDADYMKMYGGDKEAYEVWINLPTYKEKMDIVKPAFPYAKYGW